MNALSVRENFDWLYCFVICILVQSIRFETALNTLFFRLVERNCKVPFGVNNPASGFYECLEVLDGFYQQEQIFQLLS